MNNWARKRFWTDARYLAAEGGFTVSLDDKPVRTPAKSMLVLPTERMAEAVVAEWMAQAKEIDPLSMPVTRSANAAIDKVSVQKAEVVDMVAAYGDSDLICYRAANPETLVSRQSQAWDPLLTWAAKELGAELEPRNGVMHRPQDARSLSALHEHVSMFDPFQLTAFHDLVSLSGSLVIGFAVARKMDSAEALWDASRIDEVWQEDQWGRDEMAAEQVLLKRNAFLHADLFFGMSD